METELQACFSADYASARQRFLSHCNQLGLEVRSYQNPNQGPEGEELAADTAWVGDKDARNVIVTLSATHGVEGFCGSGAQLDWLRNRGPESLPGGVAMLIIHAINPHGFAWQRRVTEEGCDLNRNWIDFDAPYPLNPGFEALRDVLLPSELSGPAFEKAEEEIARWRAQHGETAFHVARGGGQYSHPEGMFYGGNAPTWSRLTLESIMRDYNLPQRDHIAVIDYHTGLGPFGYGEPICGNQPGTPGHQRAKSWYGQSLTEPDLGTSSSVPKVGLSEYGWTRIVGDIHTYIALEYGTYTPDAGRAALRADHWLHAQGNVNWQSAETRAIKQRLKNHYYPGTPDWQEMVIFRSRMILRQAQRGLSET